MSKLLYSLISAASIAMLATLGGCTVPLATGEATATAGGLASARWTAHKAVDARSKQPRLEPRRVQSRPSLSCRAPLTACGELCIDPRTNNVHCGGCGNVCPTGATCTDGSCACPSGQSPVCRQEQQRNECLPTVVRTGEPCTCNAQCQGTSVFCHGGICQYIG